MSDRTSDSSTPKIGPSRYHYSVRILHWMMALGFVMMFTSGAIMEYAEITKKLQFQMYQWHKSGGVLLLFAFCARVLFRLSLAIPNHLSGLTKFELGASKFVHKALYFLMVAIPLSGWLMVSASVFGLPTIVFGWFEWPHIPGVQGNNSVEDFAKTAHSWMVWIFAGIIVLHIAAALKHQLYRGYCKTRTLRCEMMRKLSVT
ncbi:MAG: cytochrome b561 [Paracoccaceae bacterium]|jgi:cytochrome b561